MKEIYSNMILITHILEKIKKTSFTFIPMLTENDDTNHGEKRDYEGKVGSKNQGLVNFLKQNSGNKKKRDLKIIIEYFKNKKN